MANLVDLGFQKGTISETILSTYNPDGSPNAAPMGVILKDPQHLTLNIFNSSTTLANVKTRRSAVVNVTDNIEVYFRTAIKEANPDGKLPEEWFAKASVVNAPKLCLAEASVEVSLINLIKGAEKTRAVFSVTRVHAGKGFPQVYCRAFGLTLEAIVHATRVKVLAIDQKEHSRMGGLLRKIHDCDVLVGRVAPNSSYSAVMADLIRRVDGWGQK